MRKIFLGIAACWLIINLITLTGYPAVWVDEILSADAGIHLARGQGFVSSGWFNQPSWEFWASYPPLYAFLLTGWLKLMPISAFFVRAFGLLLVSASLWMVYQALRQLGVENRWIIVVALAVCEPVAFLERAGRPDTASLFLLCATALVLTKSNGRWQSAALFVLGALAVPAALQYAACAILLGALLQFWFRPFTRRQILVWLAGLMFGAALLAALYGAHHVMRIFLESTVASKHSSAGRLLQNILLKNGQVAFVPADILSAPFRDYASPVVILMGIAAWFWAKNTSSQRLASFGLSCAVLIPLAIQILGKYPIYYTYMGAVPASVTIMIACGRLGPKGRFANIALVALLAFGGVGRFWWMAWQQGTQTVVDLSKITSTNDTLVADYPTYYEFIDRSRELFAVDYSSGKVLPRFPREQAARVTKLIVRDSRFVDLAKRVGGQWTRSQDLVVTRRGQSSRSVVFDDDTRHPTQERVGVYVRSTTTAVP